MQTTASRPKRLFREPGGFEGFLLANLAPKGTIRGMRRLIICLVVACAVAALPASVASAKGGGVMCVLHAKLAAKNEVPPTTSVAKGHTQIKVRNDGTIEFKTRINNKNRENFVAGHVHEAAVGVNGPIVVELFVPPAPATSARHIKQGGVVTPEAGTTGAELCQDPSAFYVNYHTTAFQNGAIRGQLR
jgi:CHRD domain